MDRPEAPAWLLQLGPLRGSWSTPEKGALAPVSSWQLGPLRAVPPLPT